MNATLPLLWFLNAILCIFILNKLVLIEEPANARIIQISAIHPENITTTRLDLDTVKDFKKLLTPFIRAHFGLESRLPPASILFISGTQRILLNTNNSALRPMIWYRYERAYNSFLELSMLLCLFHLLPGSISFVQKSAYQEVMVGQVKGGGAIISSNGDTQAYENDEQIYHEYLAITPLLYHPLPERVLVVGGGDMLGMHCC